MFLEGYRISLTFNGFYFNGNSVPPKSGLYVVYVCEPTSDKTVSLKKLVYIGESHDMQNRLSNHERREDWMKHVKKGQKLIFSYAEIGKDRERAEAALIFYHKPPENVEYTNGFPFPCTTMSLSGKTGLLHTSFTVYRT